MCSLTIIDMTEWDPSNDKHLLPIKFSKEDPSGKVKAKEALQKELGLLIYYTIYIVGPFCLYSRSLLPL
jgi:glycogen synthase